MRVFRGLFFVECSYFHIKNSFKTLQSIDYQLNHAQHVVISCFQHSLEHISTSPCTTALRQLAATAINARNSDWWHHWVSYYRRRESRFSTFIYFHYTFAHPHWWKSARWNHFFCFQLREETALGRNLRRSFFLQLPCQKLQFQQVWRQDRNHYKTSAKCTDWNALQ